jgi:predicted YcjX-like family ATPase
MQLWFVKEKLCVITKLKILMKYVQMKLESVGDQNKDWLRVVATHENAKNAALTIFAGDVPKPRRPRFSPLDSIFFMLTIVMVMFDAFRSQMNRFQRDPAPM